MDPPWRARCRRGLWQGRGNPTGCPTPAWGRQIPGDFWVGSEGCMEQPEGSRLPRSVGHARLGASDYVGGAEKQEDPRSLLQTTSPFGLLLPVPS